MKSLLLLCLLSVQLLRSECRVQERAVPKKRRVHKQVVPSFVRCQERFGPASRIVKMKNMVGFEPLQLDTKQVYLELTLTQITFYDDP